MDAKVKSKWVEALRSGKYQQGRGALALDEDHLCCIGVGFCVVRPNDDVNKSWTDEAAFALGLHPDQRDHLVILNDNEGSTFDQIADYIEANL